jgi:hypothetical protein
MIDRTLPLPMVRQCQLLARSRSTAYYQPTSVSSGDLALMRRIDELHLASPFAGARMLRDLLRREGTQLGPAMYLIDKQGVIRHVRIGEGGYQETERLIQSLLAEKF